MMTPEQIEAEFKHVATKEDLHKELHAQTRQFVTWMGVMTVIILGGSLFLPLFLSVRHQKRHPRCQSRHPRNQKPTPVQMTGEQIPL
jgi:hypothetical protein